MQSGLIEAIERKRTVTENGMPTESTSGNELMNLFFAIGASRTLSDNTMLQLYSKAYHENPLGTLKTFAYNRDIRGGQGERRSFRLAMMWLAQVNSLAARQMIQYVPFYGRWDDLLAFIGTNVEYDALKHWAKAIRAKDGLACKWAPRENKRSGHVAKKLAKILDMTPKQYRKFIAQNSSTVEDAMCSKNWGDINYSHVPSRAANIYRTAFFKNDADRYKEYLEELKKPKSERDPNVKVNADAIFPHDIVKSILEGRHSVIDLLNSQWDALPNYIPMDTSILCMVDTSGSMMTYDNPKPLHVAIALGIYASERIKGLFQDTFITFSAIPTLQKLKGNLSERVLQLRRAKWDSNTNLEAAFRLILKQAKEHNVPESDMPNTVLILSDMQFDTCMRNSNRSAIEMIRKDYKKAGYTMPNIIFWNLRQGNGIPVRYDESGTALVSGFSPSLLKHILSGEITPEAQMNAVLGSERYSILDSIQL